MVQEILQPKMELGGVNAAAVMMGGVHHAIMGLSQMLGQEIRVTGTKYEKILVKDIADLFGGPETIIVGVYLAISGSVFGHMLVAYKPQIAFDLVDILLEKPPNSTTELLEMETSVLGEVGNIMGSFFLNHIADGTGTTLHPSPPAVMMDMAGSILDAALANILAQADYAYVVKTSFGTGDRHLSGTFLVLPALSGSPTAS